MTALARGESLSQVLDLPIYEYHIMGLYLSKYPPDWRTEVGAAMVTAALVNVNRDPKKRPRPYDISDFSPILQNLQGKEPQLQGTRDLFGSMLAMTTGDDLDTWHSKQSTERDPGDAAGDI